ncbi:amidohydrolase family protein [Thalassomonas haliotis]|uniref:Amidohydrolase family protein n=1 Tax=Thalassomonas haliotis TaxID=485448 RepID=A0ABY7VI13_9GAMM|nr:amidohydrolase family protein [Thalassomonas haliotis]WDE13140.1 amidohydrolase family protein [Thalassomonas haliotis]
MSIENIIDPHLHLFDLQQGDYAWLAAEHPPFWQDKGKIKQTFTESDLTLSPLSLAGFVHIEAGFDNVRPWREVAYLEQNCRLPFKSVAFIDLALEQPAFEQQLQQLLSYSSVSGCRHILDQQAAELLEQPRVQKNLARLADAGLSFDLQMPLSNSKAVTMLAGILKQTPGLKVIINHAGWPPYREQLTAEADIPPGDWQAWLSGLKYLSTFDSVAIKCSGWEMAERQYQLMWAGAVISECIRIFGEQRVMLASNFPLCLFSGTYAGLWQDYLNLAINEQQLKQLLYDNAASWYGFA